MKCCSGERRAKGLMGRVHLTLPDYEAEILKYLTSAIFFREFALASLKNGSKDILVATDVAGRGIDVR
jgi:hypothetical protein